MFYLDKSEIAQGIVPNPDRVNSRNIKTLGETIAEKRGVKIGDGVFVLDKTESSVIHGSERKYLKPLFEPIHIDKFRRKVTDLSILYTKKGSFEPDQSPSIIAHLRRFREIMEARRENQTGQIAFYNLHWPRDEAFFREGEKILSPRKCESPVFYHTEDPAYVMLSMNVLKSRRINLRYLSAVLNSSTIRYWLRYKGSMQGLNFQIDAAPLLAIPIHRASPQVQELLGNFVAIIQKAYDLKESESPAIPSFFEDVIDACVMECYFREHMAQRDLLFLDELAPHLANYDPKASVEQQREFITNLHRALNAPSSKLRNRLLRLTADSPDLLAVIKAEGKA